MNNTMKGLFFIVKGQYRKDTSPRVTDRGGKTYSLGGYDPECEDTVEHYQLMDNITFKCLASGTLDNVLRSLKRIVRRHKGDLDHYLKGVNKIAPVSHSELFIRKYVYKEFGDYFADEVAEVVNKVLREMVNYKLNRSNKLKKKLKSVVQIDVPKEVAITCEASLKPRLKIRKHRPKVLVEWGDD